MYIPGELIAMITFPGVILHEIAHRFFCDINNITVHEIKYFKIWNRNAGHVIHEVTDNMKHSILIGIAPLIVNSLLCMILTLPIGIRLYFGTNFLFSSSLSSISRLNFLLELVLIWAGYSIGYNAIPSRQDIKSFRNYKPKSQVSRYLLKGFVNIIDATNIDGVGPAMQAAYAYGISLILPAILWQYLLFFH